MKASRAPKSSRFQSRRSVSRVRTGCTTCKIRRIKCDETKPSCRRCTSTGRRCDGYNVPKQLLFEICTDPVEKWSFYYFRDRTSKHAVSFQEFRLWDRVVLQASHSQDVIRRMIVAIGAYHECVDTPHWSRSTGLFRFACTQYNRALSRLRQRAFSMSIEDVLLSCVLFTFFENAKGDMDAALKHLYAANAILREEQRRRAAMASSSAFLETVLSPILDQLNISATTTMPVIHEDRSPPLQPDAFSSLKEANSSFYVVVQRIAAHLDKALEVDDFADMATLTHGMLRQWKTALERYRSSLDKSHPSEPYFELGLLHLDLLHLGSTIRLECALAPVESSSDLHHTEIRRIIQIAREMNKIFQESDEENHTLKSRLGFTPTYIPILGHVGTRCRDPEIRRQAIEVLRLSHRAESQWDSFLVADIVEYIMEIEESWTTEPVRTSAGVPESARVQLMNAMCYDLDSQTMKIKKTSNVLNPELVRLRMLRYTPEKSPFLETFWLDRRRRETVGPESVRKKVATTDPPGLQPGADPCPYTPASTPPATPPAILKAANPLTLFPDDIPGIFPQVQELPWKLWNNYYVSPDPLMLLKRMALNHIYFPSIDDGDGAMRWTMRFDKIGVTAVEGRRMGAVASSV